LAASPKTLLTSFKVSFSNVKDSGFSQEYMKLKLYD
jgi:hypothetical protein